MEGTGEAVSRHEGPPGLGPLMPGLDPGPCLRKQPHPCGEGASGAPLGADTGMKKAWLQKQAPLPALCSQTLRNPSHCEQRWPTSSRGTEAVRGRPRLLAGGRAWGDWAGHTRGTVSPDRALDGPRGLGAEAP